MNYLAQGLNQGFATGQAAYEARKKREQEEALAKAKRDLELQMHAERLKAEEALQNARLIHDINKQATGNLHDSSERALDRTLRADESAAQRKQERKLKRRELGTRKDIADAELNQRAAELQTKDNQAFVAQEWDMNPANPRNKLLLAQAAAWKARAPEDSGLTPGMPQDPYQKRLGELDSKLAEQRIAKAGGDNRTGLFNWKSRDSEISDLEAEKKAVQDAMTPPRTITSQEEYDRLPSGARFIWNGKSGRKP